jgi:hypothetical protein
MAADFLLRKLLIERVVNRRDENESAASPIWIEGQGTPGDLFAARLNWLDSLGTNNADAILEADIADSAPAGQPHTRKHVGRGANNIPAADSTAIQNAVKTLSDHGVLADGYARVQRLIAQVVAHELGHVQTRVIAEIQAAYSAGYVQGYADHAAAQPDLNGVKALQYVKALPPDIVTAGSQHHTY